MASSDEPLNDKEHQIEQVLDDIAAARRAGKHVDEDAIAAAHPHLMPELGESLAKIRRVRDAREAAEDEAEIRFRSDSGDATVDDYNVAPRLPKFNVQVPGYSILRELSRGGQGVVFHALQLSTGRKVALKVMLDGPLADERALARFRREVGVLAALNHPNIVTILDTGETAGGGRYIAMDYIGGQSLDDYLKTRRHKDKDDPSRLLRLFLKICAAVSAAHLRGIVHRDLKPSNIRIDDRGEPHILDFGLARTAIDFVAPAGGQPISITGEFLGSLPWSSPEQAEGDPDKIDIRTDVYSLGVILYQMLTGGRFPYEVVGNIRDVLNNILTAEPTPPSKMVFARRPMDEMPPVRVEFVNEAIEKIVLKALAKKRERRYQSAGELGREIANYLGGLPTAKVTTATPPIRGEAGLPRHKTLLAILGVCMVLGIVAAIAWRGLAHREPHTTSMASRAAKASTTPSSPTTIHLLQPYIDSKLTLPVNWSIAGKELQAADRHRPLPLSCDQTGPFDIHIEYTPLGANTGSILWFDYKSLHCSYVVYGIAGNGFAHEPKRWSPAHTPDGPLLVTGRRYSIVIQVREGSISAFLDGVQLQQWQPNEKALHVDPDVPIAPREMRLEPRGPALIHLVDVQMCGRGYVDTSRILAAPPATSKTVSSEPTATPLVAAPDIGEPNAASITPQIPADAQAYAGHHVKFFAEAIGWNEAAARCKVMGGHLACPKDADAIAFLQKLKGDDMTAWIGAHLDENEVWSWSDGTRVDLANFPLNVSKTEFHWVFLMRNGNLETRPKDGHVDGAAIPMVQGFICEWD